MSLLSDAPPWPSDGSEPPQRWEYVTASLTGTNPVSNIDYKLDFFGMAGWELVAVSGFTLFFKRPLVVVTKPPVRHAERVPVETEV